ncbi:DNA-directed RNA polymerase subunit omega [Mammaliicoccus sciuri]|uniref:DNA-directed RNA polymerase subunit omega n=1 Tax=Sporosarcina newyorkensis TaxID=759851 RepID=A0A1T4YFC0_9BACL|nr:MULTISPECIES: DNA-directed RNA polymerase subunit omega [Sporosarcina]MBY0222111.1 DNA-directed RNA polymerase subunit omega [Sporosarcina aquimarina]SKB00258.1 DNA-directed RNA polymerase subunit omega [Sporosarcina newyorkensis]
MLYPSVDSLKGKVDSKYTLVTLAAKRARELQEKRNELLHKYRSEKSVGRALEEVAAGVLINQQADESIIYEDEV